MRRLFSFPRRSRRRIATDVENELAFHVDSRVQELVASGPGAGRIARTDPNVALRAE